MTAEDLMIGQFVTVSPETSILEAIALTLDHRLDSLPVVDMQGRLCGVFTSEAIIHRIAGQIDEKPSDWLDKFLWPGGVRPDFLFLHGKNVQHVMSKVKSVTPTTSLECMARHLNTANADSLYVVSNSIVIGLIERRTVVNAFAERVRQKMT